MSWTRNMNKSFSHADSQSKQTKIFMKNKDKMITAVAELSKDVSASLSFDQGRAKQDPNSSYKSGMEESIFEKSRDFDTKYSSFIKEKLKEKIKENEKLVYKVQSQEKKLEQYQIKISGLGHELEKLHNKNLNLKKENQLSKIEIENVFRELKDAEQDHSFQIETLQNKCQNAYQENSVLLEKLNESHQINRSESRLKLLTAENKELRTRLERIEKTKNILFREKNDTQNQLAEAVNELSRLENKNKDIEDSLKASEKEKNKIKSEMKRILELSSKRETELANQNIALQEENAQSRRKMKEMAQNIKCLKEANEDLKHTIFEREKNFKKNENNSDKFQFKSQSLEIDNSLIQRNYEKWQKWKRKFKTCLQRVVEKNDEIKDLERLVSEIQRENFSLRDQLLSLDTLKKFESEKSSNKENICADSFGSSKTFSKQSEAKNSAIFKMDMQNHKGASSPKSLLRGSLKTEAKAASNCKSQNVIAQLAEKNKLVETFGSVLKDDMSLGDSELNFFL